MADDLLDDPILARGDPFRPPDWRRRRAEALAAGPAARRCSRHDDRWVQRYKRFLSGWHAADPAVRGLAARSDPACFHAFRLADAGTTSRRQLTRAVETRLLAGQPAADVAGRTGTEAETVEAYAALFFDLADRLGQVDWVVTQVLHPALREEYEAAKNSKRGEVAHPLADGTIKLFAYLGGPAVADLMLAGGGGQARPAGPAEAESWLDGQWRQTVRRRSAQAAQMVSVGRYSVGELFGVHARVAEVASKDGPGGGADAVGRVVQEFLRSVPVSMTRKAGDDARPGLLALAAGSAADLTAAEYAAAAAGGDPPAGLDFRIPDPPGVAP